VSDDELARLRAAHARVSRALDHALVDAKRERERADAQTERSAVLLRKLEAARGSVSFRLGRATRAAIDQRDPRRWLATFRGEDEILEDLGDDPAPIDDPIDPGHPGATTSTPLATLETLTPHGWRDTLERDPPSLVLIRGDALAAGTPWGDWGTPGGRDGLALVEELVTWCRARAIPVAYWDVDGTRPAPRLPFDLIV
jgi:hypothetical protein